MNNKKKISIIFGILFLLMSVLIIIKIMLPDKKENIEVSKVIYDNTENTLENNISNVNFTISKSDTINQITDNIIENNIDNNSTNIKNNVDSKVANSKNSLPLKSEENPKEKIENIINNSNKEEIAEVKENPIKTDSSETEKKENVETKTDIKANEDNNLKENSALANTSYTKVNNAVINEVVNIVNNEIAKNNELANSLDKYGIETKAISTTKSNAIQNTSAFTYMFVKDITKGKVEGNYTIFKERVQNQAKVFGTYYVYAEDEFVYNSKGTKAYWSQTFCYIYCKI